MSSSRTTSAQVTLDEANAILAEFGGEATEKMETEADTSSDSPTTTTAKTEDLLQHPKEEDEDAEMPQLQEIEEEMTDVNCSEKKRKD